MKQVSAELLNYLRSRKHFFMCDLYVLKLASGLTFRYANYGMDITLPDGNVYTSKGPTFERSKISLTSKIKVDKLDVSMFVGNEDTVGGKPIMHVANNGGFDCSTLSLLRCFMDTPGVVVGAVELFTGDISIKDGGGLELSLEVKSSVQKLDVEYPLRKYYPTCPYNLYSAGCGLDIDNFTFNGQITSIISGYYQFGTNLIKPDGYLASGGIEFTSGVLTGVSVPIKYSTSTGVITLLIPLSATPVIGDTFRAYPGCDRAPTTCSNKFGNFSRNRATPYIPLKETAM